ncbi:MAG TPA: DUF1638 domain-containing protein [Ilumatobacteraceae bacterium]|nr:DUF1638 domain-containing protein [Ilumatobacteraceae bacterium]HRB04221.1 DUF1638 domain-containing protein [Ilumatobacteraceae bacterium]
MPRPLVLACGALVSELRTVLKASGFTDHVDVRYLPANLHNRPSHIVPSLRALLEELDPLAERPVLIGYADCGTGGGLDALLDEMPRLQRLPGNHCYEFFSGTAVFEAMQEDELGTFYLTDFLAKHFEALLWQGLGLDRHPELLPMYFSNYTRVMLLSQTTDESVIAAGRLAAERLGLRFEHLHVGFAPFAEAVSVNLTSHRKVV